MSLLLFEITVKSDPPAVLWGILTGCISQAYLVKLP